MSLDINIALKSGKAAFITISVKFNPVINFHFDSDRNESSSMKVYY